MNSPGLIELFVIVFLFWVLLGPNKVMEGARLLGKSIPENLGDMELESYQIIQKLQRKKRGASFC